MLRFQTLLQTNWDWRAAGNFMFGGTGSGLLLMIVAAYYPATPALLPGITALALVGAGLTLVWLEIGRPKRALNVFRHPETSWMTREGFVATLMFALAFFGVVAKWPALIALSGMAALAFLYCQARILMASKGIPAWREPSILALVMATGLAEGAALLLVLLALGTGAAPWAAFVLLALLALRAVAWMNYRQRLSGTGVPPQTKTTLEQLDRPVQWGGNALPALLVAVALVAGVLPDLLYVLAGIATVASGWWLKFNIVTRAAQVQGYAFGKLRTGHPLGLKPTKAA